MCTMCMPWACTHHGFSFLQQTTYFSLSILFWRPAILVNTLSLIFFKKNGYLVCWQRVLLSLVSCALCIDSPQFSDNASPWRANISFHGSFRRAGIFPTQNEANLGKMPFYFRCNKRQQPLTHSLSVIPNGSLWERASSSHPLSQPAVFFSLRVNYYCTFPSH